MSKHGNYNKYRDLSKYNYDPNDDRAIANAIVARAEENRKTREAMLAQLDAESEEKVTADIEVDVDECAACDAVEELPTIEGDGNEPLVGVVTTRLNIRSNPEVGDNVVTVVSEGTVVMIDYPVADGDWFKVYTEAGVEGYCMKKFVKVSN